MKGVIVVHEITLYLYEAFYYIDQIQPVSFVDSFFEDTEEIKNTQDNNKSLVGKGVESLKNAFTKMIEFVKRLISRVVDKFKSIFSKDSEEQLNALEKQMQSDPNLAQKKVKFVDANAVNKLYDDAEKALENEYKRSNPSAAKAEEIMKSLNSQLGAFFNNENSNPLAKAGLSVSLTTALKIARQNKSFAQVIRKGLDDEVIQLESIEKVLGTKKSKQFDRDIRKYANAGALHRFKIRLFARKEATMEQIMQKQLRSLTSFITLDNNGNAKVTAKTAVTGAIKNRELIKDMTRDAEGKTHVIKTAVRAAKTGMKAKDFKNQIKRDKDFITGRSTKTRTKKMNYMN